MPNLRLFGTANRSNKAVYHKITTSTDDEFSLSDDEKVLFSKPGEIELNLCPETRIHQSQKPQRNWCRYIAVFCAILVILALIGVGVVYRNNLKTTGNFTPPPPATHVKANTNAEWKVVLDNRASEGGQVLFDCDEDGRQDVIVGTLDTSISSDDIDSKLTNFSDWVQQCTDLGTNYPCMGVVYALSGLNGNVLWQIKVRGEPFLFNCVDFDVDLDGKIDCIATGRTALIVAFDPRKGSEIWRTERDDFIVPSWNTYRAVALPDWNKDGIPDVLIANGGNASASGKDHNRRAGRLVVLSGRTGQPLGEQFMDIPNSRETYMSPVLYTPATTTTDEAPANTYILFGSGGETISGDLMGIFLTDFCFYIMGKTNSQHCPAETHYSDSWISLHTDDKGIFVIHSGGKKGVMVPPVIADVNNDGTLDIVSSQFDGHLVLIDGKTATKIWQTDFPGMESYSVPAPGYFDDDETLDFMMRWNKGEWMEYSDSKVTIISGKDGSILWSLDSAVMQMTSDMTLSTNQSHLDKFVFRIQGRESVYRWNETGFIMRPDTHRQKRHGGGEEDFLGDAHDNGAEFRKMMHHARRLTCDDDLSSFQAEVLIIDRNSAADSATQIHNIETLKQDYDGNPTCLDDNENQPMLKTPINSEPLSDHAIPDSTTDNHEGGHTPSVQTSTSADPRQRKHAVDQVRDSVKMCTPDRPDLMSSGLVGDLDGDGNLDYVSVSAISYEMVDAAYCQQGMHARVVIQKINMEAGMIDETSPTVTIHPDLSKTSTDTHSSVHMSGKVLLPMSQQQWTQYSGKTGDNIYKNKS